MNVKNVIPELRRQRENLARACGYDVKKLVEHYRRREAGRKAGAHRLVSFIEAASQPEIAGVLRDAPRKKGK
jgi:hypothetical protein